MRSLVRGLIGSKNERELKRMHRTAAQVSEFETTMQALSDEQLAQTGEKLKARVAEGETLDEVLPECFAAVRESARRFCEMRHFDVQIIGGITLHEGRIAEMRTGEGKTLVATLPAVLNALSGTSVHIVTVNDYLARRDAEWMGPIYRGVGIEVGVIQSGQSPKDKRLAYAADVIYGTNNEFGFDYLRDNMAFSDAERVQRGLRYAIVDEVDSILIDEARTPLIISGPAERSTELYVRMNEIAPRLKRQIGGTSDDDELIEEGDFIIDEKNRQIELTERGHTLVEKRLVSLGLLQADDSLYGAHNLALLHHVQTALKAHVLFKRDVEYIVQDGKVVIVDEHTGRTMPGRRWSDGIHQAVEAKEGLAIQQESQTLASTTFQNYFRLFDKLAGMTGTADTEAFEFKQIYGLDVVVIPTHMPMIREDNNDLVFCTTDEKYDAIVEDVLDCRERGQPVLVGTVSIESSERLSRELNRRKIPHKVLNAKHHQREAEVVAQAGRKGAVTIATNMAGRGTDIVLGGNPTVLFESAEISAKAREEGRISWQAEHEEVLAAGGLHIIGTERHESRRIDNQLRGRSGRQGDPGSSAFYLSLEDNLMRIFLSPRMREMFRSLAGDGGEAISHRSLDKSIERAQRKVEGHNFDVRKNLLEFDDVANDQRQVVYAQRNELMEEDSIAETVEVVRDEVIENMVLSYIPPESIEEQWDVEGLQQALRTELADTSPVAEWVRDETDLTSETILERVQDGARQGYAKRRENWASVGVDPDQVEKQIMLQVLDQRWKEHLANMDYLRQGIHLRAYAQKQPKQEYKRESFELFSALLDNIKIDFVRLITRLKIEPREDMEARELERRRAASASMKYSHTGTAQDGEGKPGRRAATPRRGRSNVANFTRSEQKVGRNQPCPCGSGRKFKHCHGAAGQSEQRAS